MVAGVCRLLSSVICNVTHHEAARDGEPVVLRHVRATPCYSCHKGADWSTWHVDVQVDVSKCCMVDDQQRGRLEYQLAASQCRSDLSQYGRTQVTDRPVREVTS